jgi:hypothetical protein
VDVAVELGVGDGVLVGEFTGVKDGVGVFVNVDVAVEV